MKYGYARVSTLHQDLTSQIEQLEKEGCEVIYKDKFTGTSKDRPEFMKLLDQLKAGDTLVVTKLDRFARSTREGIGLIRELFEKGIKVHVLNMGLVEDTPTGRLILSVMFAFAEFERDMIVERTQEGKQIAKQHPDFREGRPKKYSRKQIEHAIKLKEKRTYKQVEDMTGISKSTLIRAMRKRGLIKWIRLWQIEDGSEQVNDVLAEEDWAMRINLDDSTMKELKELAELKNTSIENAAALVITEYTTKHINLVKSAHRAADNAIKRYDTLK